MFLLAMRKLLVTLARGLAGFLSGFVVACCVLVFLGLLPAHKHSELSFSEIEQKSRALWMAVYAATAVALLCMILGWIHVPRYWLWFFVMLGVTSLVPFWPGMGGGRLPFATPYVNSGFRIEHVWMLIAQLIVASTSAAVVHWGWPPLLRRRTGLRRDERETRQR